MAVIVARHEGIIIPAAKPMTSMAPLTTWRLGANWMDISENPAKNRASTIIHLCFRRAAIQPEEMAPEKEPKLPIRNTEPAWP